MDNPFKRCGMSERFDVKIIVIGDTINGFVWNLMPVVFLRDRFGCNFHGTVRGLCIMMHMRLAADGAVENVIAPKADE